MNKQCNSAIKALHRVRHYNSCYWRIKLNKIRNGFQKQAPGVMCSPSSEYYSVIRSGCWIFNALWNHIRARCVSGRARLRRYIIMQWHQHNGHPFKCVTFSKRAQPSATYPATAFGRNPLTCHTHRREWMLNTKLRNQPLIHNYYTQFKTSVVYSTVPNRKLTSVTNQAIFMIWMIPQILGSEERCATAFFDCRLTIHNWLKKAVISKTKIPFW